MHRRWNGPLDLQSFIDYFEAHSTLAWILTTGSLAMVVLLVLAAPWLLVRLPDDYLTATTRRRPFAADSPPVIRAVVFVLRNALGVILVIAGLAMLLTPGQGVLTLLAGLMLTTLPGKRRLLCWILSRRTVLRTVNAIRRRKNAAPLEH